MKKSETAKILMVMDMNYPNFKPKDMNFAIETWNEMLQDYSYEEISVALKAFILSDTSGFAPTIGQLVEKVHLLRDAEKGGEMTESEAWDMVHRAVRRSSYYAEEEFEKLPPIIQRAVGSPGNLRDMATDENINISVESSNFKRAYRTLLERERDMAKMPREIKERLGMKQNVFGEIEAKA